jgi:hypothetical protein
MGQQSHEGMFYVVNHAYVYTLWLFITMIFQYHMSYQRKLAHYEKIIRFTQDMGLLWDKKQKAQWLFQ